MSHQDEVNHQFALLNIYRNNARAYLLQISSQGSITPLGTLNGLKEARQYILDIKTTLRDYYHLDVEDIPGVDFDTTKYVHLKLEMSLYERIKNIAELYGIELPEVE